MATIPTLSKHAPDCSQQHDRFPCTMCGHFPCWHRHDDSLSDTVSDPKGDYRCLGEDFQGCEHACQAFIGIIHVSDIMEKTHGGEETVQSVRRNVFDQGKE